MREMNASACDALASGVRWDSPALIASLVVLGMIDLMVIGGNLLVITAVFVSSKLRTSVTNLFIASLAVADLLLGIAVLPFSAAWEVFNEVWLFGDVWCSVWLAVDVWMCTASILNLCAISLDRYLAVTRPVSYPSIMSSKRAKMLIAGVWILSFLICFPPLVGWNDHREDTTSLLASVDDGIDSLPVVTTLYPMDTVLSSSESMTQSPPLTFDEAVSEEEASWLEQTSYGHIVLQHHHFRHQNRHRFGSGDGSGGGSINIVSSQEISSSFSQESNWSSVSNSSIPPLRLLQRAPSISASSSSSTDVVGSFDSSPSSSPSPSDIIPCPWVCELTNDAGYVVYSALGSFYIPMLVMLFFYWRIYRAAVRTTKAINQGFRTTKGSKLLGVGFGGGGSGSVGRGGGGSGGSSFGGGVSRFDEHRLTLRIHRGRGSVMHHGTSQGNWGGSSNNCNYSNASEAISDGSPPTSGISPRRLVRSRTQDKIRINVTYQSEAGEGGGGPADGGGVPPSGRRGGSCRSTGGRVSTAAALASAASSAAGTALYSVHYTGSGGNNGSSPTTEVHHGRSDYALRREGSSRRSSTRFDGSHQHLLRVSSTSSNNSSAASAALQRTESTRQRGRSSGETELIVPGRTTAGSGSPGTSPTTYESISVSSAAGTGDGGGSPGSSFGMSSCSIKRRQQQQQRNQQTQQQQQQQQQHVSRMGKRNIKAQVKRFRMETKAAKTLGIIVGGFIVCWLPFFTMYLVRAFCEDCIPPLVFSILFWLGYCNSAINPCIYALFSKDFRFAFKRIICKCFCTGRRGCAGGWNEGTAEAGGAFGGGSWGSFRRRSQRQSPHQQQQGLPSGSNQQQRRLWGRGKKKNRSPPAWLLASTWARRTSGGPAIEDCEGNGLGGNSLGEDSEGGSGGGGGGGSGVGNGGGVGVGGGGILAPPSSTSRNHNGNIEVIVTSDSR